MRTFVRLGLGLVCAWFPVAVQAQEPAAQEQRALLQLVEHQLRRIEALEQRIAELEQQVNGTSLVRPEALADAQLAIGEDEDEPFEHAYDGEPPEDPDPAAPQGDLPEAQVIDAYGSLRVLSAWDDDGRNEVRNNGTRVGIRGEKTIVDPIAAFGRLEVGVNLVARDAAILLIGDPGAPIGQGFQAISSRLGYVGVDTPLGRLSWGKQWSAYYDVAEFTDQFQVFSGAASGAWAANTDGSIPGTGRAERALLYRGNTELVSLAVQVQNRTSSPNDQDWADTWGASVIVGGEYGFAAGVAFNEVRDGVLLPNLNEPQLGDEAALFGVRFRAERWYAAGTYSILTQHEVDDVGRRFDGNGFELALRRDVSDRVWLEAGFNYLRPDSDFSDDFRVQFGVANVVYRFGDASRVFGGFKLDRGRRVIGTHLSDHVFAAGLNYTF